MWNIAVVSKKNDKDIKWFVNGYDGRPLLFNEWGVAVREAEHMNNGNAGSIFLEDDLQYTVVEKKNNHDN